MQNVHHVHQRTLANGRGQLYLLVMPDPQDSFGRRLRQIREKRGISQRHAAHAAKVSASFWSLLERDEGGTPTLANFFAVVDAVHATNAETIDLLRLAGLGEELDRINNALIMGGWQRRPSLEAFIDDDQTIDDLAKEVLRSALVGQRMRMEQEANAPSAWEGYLRSQRIKEFEETAEETEGDAEALYVRLDDPRYEQEIAAFLKRQRELEAAEQDQLFDTDPVTERGEEASQ